MDERTKKKSDQLGMPFSTAVARLNRQLLFVFAKQLGLDTCFRCNLPIGFIEEFTLEHKQAWLDVTPNLFWDLSNVAFSHFSCNAKVARKSEAFLRGDGIKYLRAAGCHKSLNAPEGKAWCSGHRDYLVTTSFDKNRRNRSGYASYCKECRSARYQKGIST